ncbi:MAG TPA: hypothetical protein VHO24_17085 [Opitutaceae bacterium]|nr:hypothetical protein [Opitutaceae bacterium]
MKTNIVRILALAPAFAVGLAVPNALASESSARAEAAVSEIKGDTAKAALKELDLEIDRLDAQLDNAPSPEEKAAATARIAILKDRRNDLRKTYAAARFDELKSDVRAEANRFGAWTSNKLHRDPASRAEREVRDTVRDVKREANAAGDHAVATMDSAAASADLAAYKLRPTDTNKEEAKAALKALDARIEALDDRADKMPRGAERDAAKRRVKALEDRKDELKGDFSKARFNAIVDEVQAEWNSHN